MLAPGPQVEGSVAVSHAAHATICSPPYDVTDQFPCSQPPTHAVDEYMPIAMNLALAYLKPELCASAGACEKQPPSALQAEALLRQSALPLEAMQAS